MEHHTEQTKADLRAEIKTLKREVAELRVLKRKNHWAEATFRDYLGFLETLVDTIPNPVFYQDTEGSYLSCNDLFAQEILGIPKERIFGRSIDDLPSSISSRLTELHQAYHKTRFHSNPIQAQEIQVRCANDEVRNYLLSKAIFRDNSGQVAGLVGVMSDITEQRMLKAKLLQNNLELALLSRTSQEFISSLEFNQVLVNILEEARQLLDVTACSIWLIDGKTQEIVCEHTTDDENSVARGWRLTPGQGLIGWVAEHDTADVVADSRLDERHFKEIDRISGTEMRSLLSVPLKVKQQLIGVLQAADESINRFKMHDQRLLTSLSYTAAIAIENARLYQQAQEDAQTKELLLREVNHRVKNNLASIIGLLYAEQMHLDTKGYTNQKAHLDDLINRIQGLSTVHEMLSVSKWRPLLLSHLTQQIINSVLQTTVADTGISIQISPSPIEVSPEQAHELALVINELATNAMKYACPEGDEPLRIWVHISESDQWIRYQFHDNGLGYSDDILQQNHQHYSIGLELIDGIVRNSLRGELAFQNDGGAVTIIKFKSDNLRKE